MQRDFEELACVREQPLPANPRIHGQIWEPWKLRLVGCCGIDIPENCADPRSIEEIPNVHLFVPFPEDGRGEVSSGANLALDENNFRHSRWVCEVVYCNGVK